MDDINIVYYINLAHRTDRKFEFMDWIKKSGISEDKINRVEAVSIPDKGYIGASLSHIKTLQTFLESSHENCIIFEDDYQPLNIDTFWSDISRLFEVKYDYDLVMCCYCYKPITEPTDHTFLHQVHQAATASGYIITRDFAKILKSHWEEGLKLLLEEEEITKTQCERFKLDVYWFSLMPISKWYCFYPRLGVQRHSYSDIEKRMTDYQS